MPTVYFRSSDNRYREYNEQQIFYHVVTIVGFFFFCNDEQEDLPACRAREPAEAATIFLHKTAVPVETHYPVHVHCFRKRSTSVDD